jgi:predicted dehydrogenase
MAPFLDGQTEPDTHQLPRFLIVGAGSRGNSYARALRDSGLGIVAAVADPIPFKRRQLGDRYIWQSSGPEIGQEFADWRDFLQYEQQRRADEAAGRVTPPKIDGVFICVLDHQHKEVATAIGPLGIHILCEKPLANRLNDCLQIQNSIEAGPESIFAIGHVLRYSPHNMLLRNLVREMHVIGDVLSLEHTEPVGFWHFSHSYVRGNWRNGDANESISAPSLLTKSCHDIDFILWMLCSPVSAGDQSTHFPATVSSAGSLKQFTKSRKPKEAGDATNCLKCPIERDCMFSAPRIYNDKHLAIGKAKWPVDIVNPEVEALMTSGKADEAKKALMASLSEDYDAQTPVEAIRERPWYGRCVWESDNDVADDQFVTFEWEDDKNGSAKTANFHMIAQTLAQCERRGHIYGTTGEIHYDSKSITVHDFVTGQTQVYNPEVPKNSHHGGGDDGLTQQFTKAVAAVRNGEKSVRAAQIEYLGCTVEEAVRSHVAVFMAEDARRGKKVVHWSEWWASNVEPVLRSY